MEQRIEELESHSKVIDLKIKEQDKIIYELTCRTNSLDRRFKVLLSIILCSFVFSAVALVIALFY